MAQRIPVGWALPTYRGCGSRHRFVVGSAHPTRRAAFTLVEMLVAMAITLVMMAAVVTLFANVSNSVRNRRATIEMSGQLRHVRNVLQQDLAGATCPGLTWQRPESNHGYIEIIEGIYRDSFPSYLTDGNDDSDFDGNDPDGDGIENTDEFTPDELAQSLIPTANDGTLVQRDTSGNLISTVNGLGDHDDILMLTVRNEREPFVGRLPRVLNNNNPPQPVRLANRTSVTNESPLAEVVWFAIENPNEDQSANGFFGEPGFRTIYRRTLLIAPWFNPYKEISEASGVFQEPGGGGRFKSEPGLVRLLQDNIELENVAEALAALIAFQDRYDLSVRLEWDHNIGRWKIMANTLGDLTKRENRFGHFGFGFDSGATSARRFPYALISLGSGYGSSTDLSFRSDPEVGEPSPVAQANANVSNSGLTDGMVMSYTVDPDSYAPDTSRYRVRPLVYVDDTPNGMPATAQAILNDQGQVVRVVHGPVPLWGTRRGEDVMMTDALAFDLRVYDPGAPLFGVREDPTDPASEVTTILEPSDAGWARAYLHSDNMGTATGIGTEAAIFPYSGQGAYVDLGYGFNPHATPPVTMTSPIYHDRFKSAAPQWFFTPRALLDVFGNQLAPGYSVYDTWSFHYENNGRNDDGDLQFDAASNQWIPLIDEGINGLDDRIPNGGGDLLRTGDHLDDVAVLGPDDVGERETAPPYDKPLRGMQAIVRVYERDSRAIRQVRVNQHFMPE